MHSFLACRIHIVFKIWQKKEDIKQYIIISHHHRGALPCKCRMVSRQAAMPGKSGAVRRRRGCGSVLERRCQSMPQLSKQWHLTLLLFVLLCTSYGLVSAATAQLNTEPTDAERPLLLYIPMHVSEPLEHLQELCDRTLSKEPWVAESGSEDKDGRDIYPLAFDILLVVSGPSDASRNATERFDVMRAMLEAATENLLPFPPRVFLDDKTVGVDKYNLNFDEEDKDAEWVSGPNSVFYDAFAEGGEIYEKYVRFYALVQQLETDVCALRGGWLSSLLRPMFVFDEGGESESESSLAFSSSSASPSSSPSSSNSSNLVIISGPTIRSSCIYVVKFDECQPFEGDATHMTEHINGNAMYRMGDVLQQVLKASREQYANAEPFDLAIHHVLKASNVSSTLAHSNPLYHNTATLLDRDWFLDFRYHGVDDLAVLHAPRRLLADGLKAVATRAQGYLPATTVVLSEESMDEQRSGDDPASSTSLLNNFKAAADELRLSGVIYIALSEEVFFEASRVVPLQVLPAFERRNGDAAGVGDDEVTAATAAEGTAAAAATAAAVEGTAAAAATAATAAAAAAAAAAVDPKSFVLTWPPTAPSPALRLLATITQLVTQGYSPLVVDAASVPLQNYDMALYGFPKDAIFFADTSPGVGDEVRRPFSAKTSGSRSLIMETMYAPSSAYTANFLQAWAVKMLERQQGQGKAHPTAAAATSATAAAAAASAATEDTKMLSIADLKALAACPFETVSGFTPCPWRGISVKTLPVHWFAPQDAFFGSGWTRRAREHALFLDMSSGGGGGGVDGGAGGASSVASSRSSSSSSPSKLIFRLRQAGKLRVPARCPTISALSRLPRDLTHETVFDELALHAEFLSFVRERKIACAVLPGFRVPSTGATLPVDALLDLETVQASAGTQATILPRVQDVEEASHGYVAFDRDRDRRRRSRQARNSLSQHARTQETLPRDADLCSAFHHFGPSSNTACLAKDISLALDKARSALPWSSFVCALDARRTAEEVSLVGLRGATGLGEVAAKVSQATAALNSSSSPPSPDAVTILLTGAWRLLPRGSFGNGISSSSSHSASSHVVTLSDLHSHDQELQCAQELNPKASPLADEAWTGVLEALLCRDSVSSVDVSRRLSSPFLEIEKTNAPRSKAAAATAGHGHRKKTNNKKVFAELVARHIPPSILLEDVAAFAKWLSRPDRPNLVRGRSLQFFFAGEEGGGGVVGGKKQLSSSGSSSISSASSSSSSSPSSSSSSSLSSLSSAAAAAAANKPPSSSSSRHKAALQSLSMLAPTIAETRADYAFLPAAADATTGELLPWSSVTEIGELYRVRPTLLPPSLAAMMHPTAVLEFLLSPGSSTLPFNVAVEAAEAWNEKENAVILDRLSQDVAFRKTVAALGRIERREAAAPRKKKLWALPHAASAAAAGHQQSREATLPVSSMGASDDVVVRLSGGTGSES